MFHFHDLKKSAWTFVNSERSGFSNILLKKSDISIVKIFFSGLKSFSFKSSCEPSD